MLLIYPVLLLLGFGFAYFASPAGSLYAHRTEQTCFYPLQPPPRTTSQGSALRSLDWTGYTLLLGGTVPLLMGFAWSSDPMYGWHDPHSYGCVAAGFASLLGCLLWGEPA